MKNKPQLLDNDVPKYRKKAVSKGLPRADHKHLYETVLLTKKYHGTDFKTGRPRITETQYPTKVCTICGRIDCTDPDPKYFIKKPVSGLPINVYEKELSENALKLPRWHADDFWDKFAKKD